MFLLLLLLINSVKTSIEDYTQMNLLYLGILLVVTIQLINSLKVFKEFDLMASLGNLFHC